MKFMLSLLALGYVASANPIPSLPVNPGGIGGLFKGPNSETIIKGPDGSVITAAAEGGEVQSELEPIVVAEPVVVENVVPIVATVDTKVQVLPVVDSKQSSDLIGPSGRISTEGSQSVVAGPSSTTISGTAVVAETVVKGPPIVGTPVVTVTGSLPVATVTSSIPVATVTGSIPAAVVTGSTPVVPATATVTTASPLLPPNVDLSSTIVTANAPSIATVTASAPSIATVTATPPVSIVTPLPQAVATASASPHVSAASATSSQGASATALVSPNRASAVVETGVTVQDQLAVDNRQIILNPPEIVVTPKSILRPTPGTLLTTPGLGSVATLTNIQREEPQAVLNVTPNTLPQDTLTQQQLLQLQQQQNILNNQIQHAQQAAGAGVLTPSRPNGLLLTSKEVALADIQRQQLLSAELAKSGIDVTQLQLTNIPLTSVSGLPARVALGGGGIAESWGRYGRNAESKKKTLDEKKKD